jgi:hypothetical protein
MDTKRYDTALRVWVVAAIAVGTAFILYGSSTVGSVGVLLVVVGLVSLMPLVRNALMTEPSESRRGRGG